MNANIRKIRIEMGLTQSEMAERMGVGRSTYCNLEYGRTSLFSKALVRFAEVCGKKVLEIISGRSEEELLRDEKNFDEIHQALVDDYERRIEALQKELNGLQALLDERDRTIAAQEKTIGTQESIIARQDRELAKYSAGD